MPASRSRTAPPTTNAWWPCSCSLATTWRAPSDNASRRTPCCSTGMSAGPRDGAGRWKTRRNSLRIMRMRGMRAFREGRHDNRNRLPGPGGARRAARSRGGLRAAQRNDGPAEGARARVQRGIGIDRDRVADTGQQRQVVERIAVKPAALEAAPVQAQLLQPRLDARDLAFAEGGYAARLAGELPVALCRDGRHQVRDTEFARDGRGDETIGGGDDGRQIPAVEMAPHQRTRRLADERTHAHLHEFAMPGVELEAGMAGQRLELEIEKLVDVQGARLVLLVELGVACLVDLAVEYALADEELRPFEVRIAAEQGVVEIE